MPRANPDPRCEPPVAAQRHWRQASGAVALATFFAAGAPLAFAAEGWSAGISADGKATAAEVGLPTYPGAQLLPNQKEGKQESLQFNLWGGAFGLKLVVARYQTPDRIDQVAAFYQPLLGKFGTVLECPPSGGGKPNSSAPRPSGNESKALSCDDDHAEPGGRLFKAGTRRQQRIVGVEPMKDGQSGSRISLVRLELSGD
jgi:hypothetical protein